MKKKICFLVVVLLCMLSFLTGCRDEKKETKSNNPDEIKVMKPVIYLYPETKMEVDVHLDYDGNLDFTYPSYDNGWKVTAYPDGTLINHKDRQEYSYLFWEGASNTPYDMSKGFVVKGEDSEEFLKEKLAYLGLLPKEYNEFLVYWLPQMVNNPYNLISFQEDIYWESAVLTIEPKPDSIQRVFMAFMPLDNMVEIEEQILTPFERKGFSVIEWGGAIIE